MEQEKSVTTMNALKSSIFPENKRFCYNSDNCGDDRCFCDTEWEKKKVPQQST